QLLGWNVIGYDPLVQRENVQQVEFNALLKKADAISIHVPLTQTGPFATHHLINADALALMQPETILINSARGAVVEEAALMADILKTRRKVVLDV
ncbi:NAD(P)-dependent oxidoreductase, partial [Acinetobacter nosocomialis]